MTYAPGLMALFLLLPPLPWTGTTSSAFGVPAPTLPPCPASPNCVSSDASDAEHRVAPFLIAGSPAETWQAVGEIVGGLPRTRVVTVTPGYLHAECRSALFRFVDDLELQLRADEGIVAVRSASRLGYSDLGVNRRRVERIRSALARRGVVRE